MRDWIALAQVDGVGPRLFHRLVERLGSPTEVLCAPAAALREIPGLGQTIAQRIIHARSANRADEQLRLADRCGAQVLLFNSDAYPPLLKQIYDPPPVLFVRGRLDARDANAVAFVGPRRAGDYGRRVTRYLAMNCAQFGFTIVSGLAAGVDSEAHRGALEAGGRTIAVLPSGLDVPYPKYNVGLLEEIVAHGAAVSECPMGAAPERGAFPARNRIVSGLALGTVVTAAGQKSGALITARHAMDQGREVMAVPGDIFTSLSDGVHALLRDGATLVQDPFDIRAALEPYVHALAPLGMPDGPVAADGDLPDDEKIVFNLLSLAPVHIDDVMAQGALSAAQAAAVLLNLELRGLVRQLQGKHFVRAVR